MGLNLSGVRTETCLRTREMKDVLRVFRMDLLLLDSSTTSKISYFTTFQQALKKSTLKPFGPAALPFSISLITILTFALVTGLFQLKLSSLDTILGIFFIISLMWWSLSRFFSFVIPLKWCTITASILLCMVWSCPSSFNIEEILLCVLLAMAEWWKTLVFHSSSLSHWTLDFCLQKISSWLHKFSHSRLSFSAYSFLDLSKPSEVITWFSTCILISTNFLFVKMLP